MKTMIDQYFPVLDHGFVSVVDYMGNDQSIARAARCSYGEGTKKKSDDRGLIRHLMRKQHTSPFEQCEIVLHIGLPIFVARQLVRHRTCSMNEYSGRFSVMPMLFYEPTQDRHELQSQTNKQGSRCGDTVTKAGYKKIRDGRQQLRQDATDLYRECLSQDLTRELARIDLPLSMYTYWYWKMDLHNLLKLLKLRLDYHAQWEIREYAKVIAGIVQHWVPMTWEAFDDYVLNGVCFSRQEQAILSGGCNGSCDPAIDKRCFDMGMSVQETRDFREKLRYMGGQYTEDIALDLNSARPASYYEQLIAQHAVEV